MLVVVDITEDAEYIVLDTKSPAYLVYRAGVLIRRIKGWLNGGRSKRKV